MLSEYYRYRGNPTDHFWFKILFYVTSELLINVVYFVLTFRLTTDMTEIYISSTRVVVRSKKSIKTAKALALQAKQAKVL